MSNLTDFDSSSDLDGQLSLEEALERCLLALERDSLADRARLVARFPKWKSELNEFLENWGNMERCAAELSDQRHAVRKIAPDGAQVRYFGDYELLEEIGHGGMGIIYKARQISLDRVVAIKMILNASHDRDRFRLEAEAAASLEHPNIVSIYEIGEHQGHPYFSMQFIEGCNLKEHLEKTPLEPEEAARLMEVIARAVHFAHQRGVLHRDLKTANVLLDSEGQPHITDFGLAKQLERESEITHSGAILGTPGYMAPEQATGQAKSLTMATDVYGLGSILYALLTGKAPFSGQSALETLRQVVEDAPAPPRVQDRRLHRDIETICLKCLEKSPQARYASAELLADDLIRFLKNEPVEARPVTPMERCWRWCRRNPMVATLTAAVTGLLLLTTVTSFFLASSERNARVIAERGRDRESELREDVDDALEKAQTARDSAMGTLADSYTSNGLWADQLGNDGEALLWFAEAVKLADDDKDRQNANLIRCQRWLDESPFPVGALWLRQGFEEIERSGGLDRVEFRPGAAEVLCKAGSQCVVWNFETGEQWHPETVVPDVSYARWSPDGQLLGIAGGKSVAVVDAEHRRVVYKVELEETARHLSFSHDGRLLAIAAGSDLLLWDAAKKQFIGPALEHPASSLYVAIGPSGDRVVTIYANGRAYIYAIAEDGATPLFNVASQIEKTSESRRAFGPTFIAGGAELIVKTSAEAFQCYDVRDGKTSRPRMITGLSYIFSVSPEGEHFVIGGSTHARVIEMPDPSDETGRFVRHRERLAHDERVTTAAISSTGLVATGGWDREVRLWPVGEPSPEGVEPDAKRPSLAVLPHQTRIRQVEFSPDARHLATVQMDGLIRIWRIPSFRGNAYSVPFTAGGSLAKLVDRDRWINTGITQWSGNQPTVTMRDIATGHLEGAVIDVGHHLLDASVSPDMVQMATIQANLRRSGRTLLLDDGTAGSLQLWSWPSGDALSSPIPMPAEPRSVQYRPDGAQLAILTAAMEVVLVDTETRTIEATLAPVEADGNRAKRINAHPAHYLNGQLRYSPDGKTLVAWGIGDGTWVWDVQRRRLRCPHITNRGWQVQNVDLAPDGAHIALAGGRNTVARIVEVETGDRSSEDIIHPAAVFDARFSPDGGRLVTACRDGQARVFDWRSGRTVLGGMAHSKDVLEATFTPDSQFILTIGLDRRLRVWHASDGRPALRPFRVAPRARHLLVTPDSRYAIAAGARNEIRVLDLSELYEDPVADVEQLSLSGMLLSSKMIRDGGTVKLTTAQWLECWEEYQASSGF